MNYKYLFLLPAILISTFSLRAQQTGNFNEAITFDNDSRMLSLHVPENYNPDTAYRVMIGLHGLGDNSTNYRNFLINQKNWPEQFPHTIFVFPDGGGFDFYIEPGSEEIIPAALDYVRENYHTDSSYTVLQGFSLGGRSALKYGLDNPEMFKGLLLSTPAVQGPNDGRNDPNAGLHYEYSNADQIPIHIVVGELDFFYYVTLNKSTVPLIKKNNGILSYTTVSNMPHTVLHGSEWLAPDPYEFFESPTSEPYDLDLFDMQIPHRTCSESIPVNFFFRNRGEETVNKVEIHYASDAESGTYTWEGSLGFYEHAEVQLPAIAVSEGIDEIELEIGLINDNIEDPVSSNNRISKTLQVEWEGDALPALQDFSAEEDMWPDVDYGNLITWERDMTAKRVGTASNSTFNSILFFYTMGNRESFESPLLDFTSVSNPTLIFYTAFNYHRYTPPYFEEDTDFADTLEILISLDCGETFEQIYKKGGEELATVDEPIVNALSIQQAFFTPGDDDWRQEVVDLTEYKDNDRVLIRFNYISAQGGEIYVDDIRIEGSTGIDETASNNTLIYPNPAGNFLNIRMPGHGKTDVRIYDLSGRQVLQETMNEGNGKIELSGLNTGTYILNAKRGDGEIERHKITVVR